MTNWFWGSSGPWTGLGDPSGYAPKPVAFAPTLSFIDVHSCTAFGLAVTLFLASDRTLYMAGTNRNGGFGDGTPASEAFYAAPALIPSLANIVRATAGDAMYALDTLGNLWAWGSNRSGQLAQGAISYDPIATPFIIATNIVDFDSAFGQSLITLSVDGTVRTVGYNGNGELVNGMIGTPISEPNWQVVTPAGSPVIRVVAGYGCSMLIRADGSVVGGGLTTGANYLDGGQLGSPGIPTATDWIDLPYTNALDGGAGYATTYVLTSDGRIFGMGQDNTGQLGIGYAQGDQFNVHITTPTEWINPGVAVAQIPRHFGSAFHVLGADGKVYTSGGFWLGGGEFAAGDGTTLRFYTPTWRNGLTGLQWISSQSISGYAWAGNLVARRGSRSFGQVIG